MPRYLADSTVWAWAKRRNGLRERLSDRIARGEVATCVPVALEVLDGARGGEDYEEDWSEIFAPLEWLALSDAVGARALEVQRGLARTTHGAHRMPAIDYLIAATAEAAGDDVVLWHFDADLRRLCEFTRQRQEAESHGPRRR